MLTQIDLDDDHTDALEHMAKANGMSRRAYAADFIEKALDRVPGLMGMIRQRRASGLTLDGDMAVPEQKSILLKEDERPQPIKKYRFRYLDTSLGEIEAEGETPGKALKDALGLDKFMPYDEYEKMFYPVERLD